MWTIGLVEKFWSGYLAYFIMSFVCWTLLGLPANMLVIGCVGALYRQKLREKFQMVSHGGLTYVWDCGLYACCTCCALVQEARMVEDAVRMQHPAVAQPAKAPEQQHAPSA